jgi:hypothetical protein
MAQTQTTLPAVSSAISVKVSVGGAIKIKLPSAASGVGK